MATLYDERYVRGHERQSLSSARRVVPIILELTQPQSVVDVGCGSGAWLSVFADHGVSDLIGIDGYWDRLVIPEKCVVRHDLNMELRLNRRFDLALALEVAEHLRPSAAATFVASLTRLAPVVLFSAAVPMQGGTGHVNEQRPEYWANLFSRHEFTVLDPVRRRIWKDEEVSWWYAQNTLMFVECAELERQPLLRNQVSGTIGTQLNIAHPAMVRGLAPRPEVLEFGELVGHQLRVAGRAPRAAGRALRRRLGR